jgi:hypothetical protein
MQGCDLCGKVLALHNGCWLSAWSHHLYEMLLQHCLYFTCSLNHKRKAKQKLETDTQKKEINKLTKTGRTLKRRKQYKASRADNKQLPAALISLLVSKQHL